MAQTISCQRGSGVNASVGMIRIIYLSLLVTLIDGKRVHLNEYEASITFTVFNNDTADVQVSTFDRDFATLGCDPAGNFAIVVHGWKESIWTPWVADLIKKLNQHRGGCVIFMDYSKYSIVADYFNLARRFDDISAILLKKVRQIGNYDRLFMFGFSFGSRLCFEVGAQLGHQLIERIDACDPAGPAFDGLRRTVDPKSAAKNVACINTSTDKGTNIYNCHQNFRMGKCGKTQPAAGPAPLGNHGLCPYFYVSAFDHEFRAEANWRCPTDHPAVNLPNDYRMGYLETRVSPAFWGDIFIPTSKVFPWNIVNENFQNKLNKNRKSEGLNESPAR